MQKMTGKRRSISAKIRSAVCVREVSTSKYREPSEKAMSAVMFDVAAVRPSD